MSRHRGLTISLRRSRRTHSGAGSPSRQRGRLDLPQLRHILAGMYLAIHGQAYISPLRSGMLLDTAAPHQARAEVASTSGMRLQPRPHGAIDPMNTYTPHPRRFGSGIASLLLFAVLLSSTSAAASTYFVDPATGSDGNDGASATTRGRLFPARAPRTPRLPANAMGKVSNASRLKCGDTVLLKGGSTHSSAPAARSVLIRPTSRTPAARRIR